MKSTKIFQNAILFDSFTKPIDILYSPMPFLQILRNIQKHISLSDAEKLQLQAAISVLTVQKKQLILEQGEHCKYLFFVDSGSLRAFNLSQNGKESTVMFAVKDWWITDMNAFVNQRTSLLSIEALETGKILALSFQKLEHLYQNIPQLERFFRILFQNAYIREQQRALRSISLSTEKRYRHFVENYPAIVLKTTQKQVASYLGVTPEFLSAIKKK